jgi:hypothetical protein
MIHHGNGNDEQHQMIANTLRWQRVPTLSSALEVEELRGVMQPPIFLNIN